MDQAALNAMLETLSTETGDFWVSRQVPSHELRSWKVCVNLLLCPRQIRRVAGPISPLEFMRAVSRSEPLIITGVASQWPAFKKYLFLSCVENAVL